MGVREGEDMGAYQGNGMSSFSIDRQKAVETLIFYAKEENWPDNPTLHVNSPKTERDLGDLARKVLDEYVPGWREL